MESARGLYSRLAGVNPDQDLDEGMDSLLSLPQVNPNQPREWLHIDPQGRTRYALVTTDCCFPGVVPSTGMLAACEIARTSCALQLWLVSPTSVGLIVAFCCIISVRFQASNA